MLLNHRRTGETLASDVSLATTRRERRRGLLGRTHLPLESALVLTPCHSIHTMFMRFAIDVVFVDGEGRILRIVRELPPWRAAWARGARAVIELAAGALGHTELNVGDALYLMPATPATPATPAARDSAASRSSSSLRQTAARPAWLGSQQS